MIEAFGEERADGAVNQTAGEDFFFALFAFSLEKAAGDFACGIGALHIIHGERKKVLSRFDFFVGGYSNQNHCITHGHLHRTCGLAGDFASFNGYGVLAVLESFCMFLKHSQSLKNGSLLPLKC